MIPIYSYTTTDVCKHERFGYNGSSETEGSSTENGDGAA